MQGKVNTRRFTIVHGVAPRRATPLSSLGSPSLLNTHVAVRASITSVGGELAHGECVKSELKQRKKRYENWLFSTQ